MRIRLSTASGALGLALTLGLGGCNTISTPPQPMNPDELKAAVDKATPEQQIDWYRRSPMPADQKAAKIKEIQDKYHIKDDAAGNAQTGR